MFKKIPVSNEQIEDRVREFMEGSQRPVTFSDPFDRIMTISGVVSVMLQGKIETADPFPPILLIRNKDGYALYDLLDLYRGRTIEDCWEKIKVFLAQHDVDLFVLASEATMTIADAGDKLSPLPCAIIRAEERNGKCVIATPLIVTEDGKRRFDLKSTPPPTVVDIDRFPDSLLERTLH